MYEITAEALVRNSFNLVQSAATDYFVELVLGLRTNMEIISSTIKIYFNLKIFYRQVGNNIVWFEFMISTCKQGNCSTRIWLGEGKNCIRPANNCGIFHCNHSNWVLCSCESKHWQQFRRCFCFIFTAVCMLWALTVMKNKNVFRLVYFL